MGSSAVTLSVFFQQLNVSIKKTKGVTLSSLLSVPWGQQLSGHIDFNIPGVYHSPDVLQSTVSYMITSEQWKDAVFRFLMALLALDRDHDAKLAFEHHLAFTQHIIRLFSSGVCTGVHLPVLFTACKDLRFMGILLEKENTLKKQSFNYYSEDESMEQENSLHVVARVVNRAFTVCINDRAPLATSRKWGAFYIMGLLFKMYLRLNCIHLTKNVLRAMKVVDLPDITHFPKSHIVMFRYYMGIVNFLNQDYSTADQELDTAFHLCHKTYTRNLELILAFWIPSRILSRHMFPTQKLLSRFPSMAAVYVPLCQHIRSGNLRAFDDCLKKNEALLAKTRTFIALEKIRELCLRNLFRKVWLMCGKSTRIPIECYQMAICHAKQQEVPLLRVETLIANLIYRGYIKGYLSHDRSMSVLSAKDPFPITVPVRM